MLAISHGIVITTKKASWFHGALFKRVQTPNGATKIAKVPLSDQDYEAICFDVSEVRCRYQGAKNLLIIEGGLRFIPIPGSPPEFVGHNGGQPEIKGFVSAEDAANKIIEAVKTGKTEVKLIEEKSSNISLTVSIFTKKTVNDADELDSLIMDLTAGYIESKDLNALAGSPTLILIETEKGKQWVWKSFAFAYATLVDTPSTLKMIGYIQEFEVPVFLVNSLVPEDLSIRRGQRGARLLEQRLKHAMMASEVEMFGGGGGEEEGGPW